MKHSGRARVPDRDESAPRGNRPQGSRRRRKSRRLILLVLVAVIAAISAWCDYLVGQAGQDRIVTSPSQAPATRVALLLGTIPKLRTGEANPYYLRRIEAAVALFEAGTIEKILISGDNSRAGYNEPQSMKDDLCARGIPAAAIVLDFAGFRTLDSVVRAKEVFGLTEAIVISQRFHLERAIYLGDHRGIRLTGFAAEDAPALNSVRVRLREVGARLLAVGDIVFARAPKFLGPRISLDG